MSASPNLHFNNTIYNLFSNAYSTPFSLNLNYDSNYLRWYLNMGLVIVYNNSNYLVIVYNNSNYYELINGIYKIRNINYKIGKNVVANYGLDYSSITEIVCEHEYVIIDYNKNNIRYKGYYYDKETNLYYLKSRYYDPSIGYLYQ